MTNKHPRLRSHIRRRKNGRVVVYYLYDMRGTGEKDIPLGTDYEEAVKKWDEIHNRKPRIQGTLEQAFSAWEKEALPNYKNQDTRKSYARHLKQIRPVFGPATWDAIEMSDLKSYLKRRTAKTQGNREMSLLSVIWNWARGEGYTSLSWPAAGMERSGWKNKEKARVFQVTDELFEAVYAVADPVLQACMDTSTATGLRITDVRTITMPQGGMLRFQANKTEKPAFFDISASPVLTALYQKRLAIKAMHVMFLSTPSGKQVSYPMLRSRWEEAREAAAVKAEKDGDHVLAEQIRAMYLRDMRKRAADLAAGQSGDVDAAAELLQHSSKEVTKRHYLTVGKKLTPAR